MIHSKTQFDDGITIKNRVSFQNRDSMQIIDGYSNDDGSLVPMLGVASFEGGNHLIDTANPLPAVPRYTTTPQTPVMFRNSAGLTQMLVRGNSTAPPGYPSLQLWKASPSAGWSPVTGTALLADNLVNPTLFGKGIIYPTRYGLYFVEPDSPSTTRRYLSVAGPCDYSSTMKPDSVTPSTDVSSVFGSDMSKWGTPATGVTIENLTSVVKFTLTSVVKSIPVSFANFASIGARSTSGSHFWMLQVYNWKTTDLIGSVKSGSFENDESLASSGLAIELETSTSAGVKTLPIPALKPGWNNIIYNVGSPTAIVQFARLVTTSEWTSTLAQISIAPIRFYPEIRFADNSLTELLPPAPSAELPTSDVSCVNLTTAQLQGGTHAVQYRFCFVGKSSLVDANFVNMVSNPSLETDLVNTNPWQSQNCVIQTSGLASITLSNTGGSGGSGYVVGELVKVDTGNGDGTIVVRTVNSGVVLTMSVVDTGSGYTTGYEKATTSLTGGGTGLRIGIHSLNVFNGGYGDYLTHFAIYRRTYDSDTKIYSSWKYAGCTPLSVSIYNVTINDDGSDIDPVINGVDIPEYLEMANDFGSSAAYVTASDGRLYCQKLDYDIYTGIWQRPTAIQVSGYNKHWAFSTGKDSNPSATDGTELDGYAVTGTKGMGIITWRDNKYVFLDNEFFLLRGDNPVTGWQFVRIDSIGLNSRRTLCDCHNQLIWLAPDGYFYSFSGGATKNISRLHIDPALIANLNAESTTVGLFSSVFWDNKYILLCVYNGVQSLLIYDTILDSWKIRNLYGMTLKGICAFDGCVYGLENGAAAVKLFTGSTSYGYDVPAVGQSYGVEYISAQRRTARTGYVMVGPPDKDVLVKALILELTTTSTPLIGEILVLTFDTQGSMNATASLSGITSTRKEYMLDSTKTRHRIRLNLMCNAIRAQIYHQSGSGADYSPTIYSISFECDETRARE